MSFFWSESHSGRGAVLAPLAQTRCHRMGGGATAGERSRGAILPAAKDFSGTHLAEPRVRKAHLSAGRRFSAIASSQQCGGLRRLNQLRLISAAGADPQISCIPQLGSPALHPVVIWEPSPQQPLPAWMEKMGKMRCRRPAVRWVFLGKAALAVSFLGWCLPAGSGVQPALGREEAQRESVSFRGSRATPKHGQASPPPPRRAPRRKSPGSPAARNATAVPDLRKSATPTGCLNRGCRGGKRAPGVHGSGYSAFPTSCDSLVGPKPTFDSESYCSSFPENFRLTVTMNGVS